MFENLMLPIQNGHETFNGTAHHDTGASSIYTPWPSIIHLLAARSKADQKRA